VRDDRTYLLHALDAQGRLQTHAKVGKERFLSDRTIQEAVIRNFEVLGEATKNLSAGLKSSHPEVDWKAIAGLRDILIHEYFGVNHLLLWDLLATEVVPLRVQVEAILADLPGAP
jgi:uncharacterized protein with HEPN domain